MSRLPEDLKPGTWSIDPAHSEFGFTVRHAGISKVRGRFSDVEGEVRVGEDLSNSAVTASADAKSFDSGQQGRDEHVRGADFLDVEKFPTLKFESTRVAENDGDFVLEGNLTIKDVTKPVTFNVEYNGTAVDPFGALRAGFAGSTQISRKDFGMTFNAPLDGGGVLVGDKVTIGLDLAAVYQDA